MEQKKVNQDSYDKFVLNALEILHSPETTNGIVNRVISAPDKVDAVGEIALDVVTRLEQSAEQNNFQITAGTIMNGTNTIVGEVINIAEAAGMESMNDEQKYQAFSWTVSNYINNAVKSGRISQEELIQIGQQMAQTKEGKDITQRVMADENRMQKPGILAQGGV